VKRRQFITLLGGAAAWPLAARAQQGERMRRVGALMNTETSDTEVHSYLAAFREALQRLGWTEGQNVRFDIRGVTGDTARLNQSASELVALSPDVILAAGVPQVNAIQSKSRSVPIVFAQAIDPIGAGTIASLARPGGNATGFSQFDYSLSGKWPELLKEIFPRAKRMAIVRDPSNPAGIGQWAVIQSVALSLGLDFSPIDVRNPAEIERGIETIGRGPDGGLVVPVSAQAFARRSLILGSAARHRVPAVYPYRYFVAGGGLLSYGPNLVNQFRQAAAYVDRILRGEKPADLPVQNPTKYEMVINLKTANALGLTVPDTLLARADEVIE
jgi:putative tryptophan/tyrosine transport system substrate-binding protein